MRHILPLATAMLLLSCAPQWSSTHQREVQHHHDTIIRLEAKVSVLDAQMDSLSRSNNNQPDSLARVLIANKYAEKELLLQSINNEKASAEFKMRGLNQRYNETLADTEVDRSLGRPVR